MNFKEGSVVISNKTGQAGTIVQLTPSQVWVLLRNTNVLVDPIHNIRFPQDQADLDACPIEVERFEEREALARSRRRED